MKIIGLIVFLLMAELVSAQDEKLIFKEKPLGEKMWVYPDSPLYKLWAPTTTAVASRTEEEAIKMRKLGNQISRQFFTRDELKKLSVSRGVTEANVVFLCDWTKKIVSVSFYFPQKDATILTEAKLRTLIKAWKGRTIDFSFQRSPRQVKEEDKTAMLGVAIYNFTLE